MKAVRLVAPNEPLELQEIPIPEIGNKDVLIKIKAAGICHSDVHYRAGISAPGFLPITMGHEVAGQVEKIGKSVTNVKVGDRVCLHYLVTCGECQYCVSGNEQFCRSAKMLGHHIDGGYAEYIAVPAKNAIQLPDVISYEQGATLMCASATSFHALMKGRIKPGDKVAVFGVGGLGLSAVQLAKAFGATSVFAIDIHQEKLDLAKKYGAIPIHAKTVNPVEKIKELTNNLCADVVLELVGLPLTQRQAIEVAGIMARVVFVGLSKQKIEINSYRDLLGNEVELIGSNDHHLSELPLLLDFAKNKSLDTSAVVTNSIPLDAQQINHVLDELEKFSGNTIRTVIVP